ncbi:hypothetical protein MVEG_00465 [Podila verticillata NRRL 6337]|nr:hypothetical protein MVEG_00465 [Podila verticillata NRRL 6337]
MATEYLEKVNQELREIESFFQELYQSSSALPQVYTPGLLPYLRLNDASSLGSGRRMSTSSYKDNLLDDFVLEGVTTPVSSAPSMSLFSESEEIFTADLRVRYKELKAIQDQLHLELTRHQLWKESVQYEKASSTSSTTRPDQARQERGREFFWSNLSGRGPTAGDTSVNSSSSTPVGRGRCFRRRCASTDDITLAQSPEKHKTDAPTTSTSSNSDSNSGSSARATTTVRPFGQASIHIKLKYAFSVLMALVSILVGVKLYLGHGDQHVPQPREHFSPNNFHITRDHVAPIIRAPVIDLSDSEGKARRAGDSKAPVYHAPVIDIGGCDTKKKDHRCKSSKQYANHQHGAYPWPRH